MHWAVEAATRDPRADLASLAICVEETGTPADLVQLHEEVPIALRMFAASGQLPPREAGRRLAFWFGNETI